ncbi:excinuclease ABC subunit UvrA [Chitinophaga polysaccharea]|uniref:excinuclease ABC subunit UvrA n=1 Tax=Chitinophaga TaxID=79328 RepID=UPI001455B4CB|nr:MULTISPECIES: excinuclease ABC subunit UvrA [Chitinophaga]NLR61970.1 excinuclease ABC subunit UvrA [Chitinophaga polysaccharea]NLU94519.1 excinuclease ABC subunit UvrA [Chitinophaga sp. Ak27]
MATKVKKETSAIDPQEVSPQDHIFIKGARVHNLKNVSVSIPRSKLVVVTGVSGSGKSSLTMDTLYAEGQRRYAESLSSYARQFLMRMNKPDVDYIKGICPAIAIEQKVITRTPRSTVGSMTEIYDYLRLLFGRVGKTYSPISGKLVKKHEVSDVVDFITKLKNGSKVLLLVPFRRHAKRESKEELGILQQKGFSRLYVPGGDGNGLLRIEELLEQKKITVPADAWVLIDRLVVKDFEDDDKHRIADSVQTAFYESEGDCFVEVDGKDIQHFANRFELDGITFEEPVPNLFSFNNPYGACPTCEGFGQVLGLDADLVIPDKRLSVFEGAIAPWRGEKMGEYKDALIKVARKFNFPVHKPIAELTDEQVKLLWTGNEHFYGLNEFFKMVEQNLYKVQYRVLQARYRGRTICPECGGGRLRKEALYIKVGNRNIAELVDLPVSDLKKWFDELDLNEYDQQIAKRILIEINHRIKTLLDVGLGYLTLNRVANTLSGGESQRIQLTRTLGSNLTNSMYILDEPSIGLHARDTHRLIAVLKELRDLGNTVVVVEHDEQMMEEADYIIDMGPLASHLGGEVIFAGTYPQILKDGKSLTGKYLSGQFTIDPPAKVRKWKKAITVEGARQHNLKNITVDFPLQVLTVISGVSGSGKTTLVKQILYPALMKLKGEFAERVGNHKALKGAMDDITQVEMIDQNPIGKSSRSNPVTYIKAYDEIRDLYSKQQLSKMRGFQPKHFSFNVDGGRCDACKGEGEVIVEMQFLADVHLTCESCGGKRFKDEVLEVTYKGKNIYEVLEMGVDEALDFFKDEKEVCNKIRPLSSVGLGYVKLGQSSDTLSGGEAQRVKLASFLGKGKAQGHILFIFDEPTTGLHFHDIRKLLDSFNALIDQGHTVLVIEHNLDVIRSADWVIDLGPEGGAGGGNLLYAGVPDGLKKVAESYTGKFL